MTTSASGTCQHTYNMNVNYYETCIIDAQRVDRPGESASSAEVTYAEANAVASDGTAIVSRHIDLASS